MALARPVLLLCLCVALAACNYLQVPRIHFSGTFYCEVGTLNNYINNYDPANPIIPWWDPDGLNLFSFSSVDVRSAITSSTGNVDPSDCAVGAVLASNGNGKIVDLDPDQQFQSQLYGVRIRLSLDGSAVFDSELDLSDMQGQWMRSLTTFAPPTMLGNTTQMRSAYWQTVLTNVVWRSEPPACSPSLRALYEQSKDTLSIKFNTDNYDNRNFSATFRTGRIAGTIGLYQGDSKQHISNGRLLNPTNGSGANFALARLDSTASTLTVDVGNSVQVQEPGGDSVHDTLVAAIRVGESSYETLIGGVVDTSRAAYLERAGVVTVPLTSEELLLLDRFPVALLDRDGEAVVQEDMDGHYAFWDVLTARLERNQSHTFQLTVLSFGQPSAGVDVPLGYRHSPMPWRDDRINNLPLDGVSYPSSIVTNENGTALLTVTANLLGASLPPPRQYIDSQVYFIGNDSSARFDTGAVSVLVFNSHPSPTLPVTWAEARRYFDLYGRLFPTMNYFVNLTKEESVKRSAPRVLRTLELDHMDPSYMPVTRDLSQYEYEVMKAYLEGA